METPKETGKSAQEAFEIDYDHVNVAALMEKIIKAAVEAPPSAPPGGSLKPEIRVFSTSPADLPADAESAGPPLSPRPSPPQFIAEEALPAGPRQKIKKIVRKLMRPFFPIIRLLGFPIHEELRATVRSLHETNQRLDYLEQLINYYEEKFDRRLAYYEEKFERKFQMLERRFEQRQEELAQELRDRIEIADQRMEKGELRLDTLEARQKDLDRSMVYIQLLHGLGHNLVVELTKLKIESEALKTKFRILEKDQELLQQRERAVERQVVK
jgi:hypothetical protein